MATATRAPTSDEAVSGTWNGSAGTRYTVVDDYPDTTPTDTLLHGTTTAGNLTFGFSAFSIPAGATNISVQVMYYDQKTASQACTSAGRLKVGGTYYNATTHNPAQSYTQRTDDWTTNPKTSAAWTVAQVNGTDGTNPLQAFGFFSNDANPSINYSSVQIQVTYTVAYSLTAAVGTFTHTGVDATIRENRILGGAVGTFTESGVAANILRSKLLTSAAGAYALDGKAASFIYVPATGYTLTGVAGGFTLGLNSASLLANRLLGATAGSYSLTGKDASTLRSRLLVGAPGGLSASFSDAGFIYWQPNQYVLGGNAGAYLLSGIPASFTYWVPQQYSLGGSSGSFSLVGKPATVFFYDGTQIRILSDGELVRLGAIGARTSLPWWEGDYQTFDPRWVLRDVLGRTYNV